MGKELELAIKIGGRLDKSLGSAVNNAQKQLNSIGKVANNVGMAVTAGVVTAGTKLVVDSVNTYKGYQSALNSAAATGGIEVGTEAYKALDAAATEAGKTTVKTAEESANALEYMMLAGWSVKDSTQALMPVLKLSASTGMDLANCSDLVTDSMSAMGLEIDDVNHYLDTLAKANNTANYKSQELLESFIGVGGVLKNLNVSFEDGAAVLGVMANQGLKGSEAGTALNAILVNMQKRSGESFKAMSKLGISMYDSSGKARNLLDIFQDVHDKTASMTQEQKNLMYQMIGGKSHYEDFAKIMAGFSNDTESGVAQVYELAKAYKSCDGALDSLYDIKTDTLEGSMTLLESAVYAMKKDIGEKISPYLQDAVQNLTAKMPDIENVIVNSLERIIPAMSKVFDYIVNNSDKIISTMIGIAKSFIGFKITTGTIKGINGIAALVKNLSALKSAVGGAKVLQGILGTFTGIGTSAGTLGGAITGGIATLLSIAAPLAGIAAVATAPFAATVGAAAIASKAIENYKQGLLDSAQAAADAATGVVDVTKQTQTLSEYYNKWQDLNNLRSNGQSLAEDEAALQEVEQWFVDNYGQFISAWEQKNGVLASTVEYVKEYQEALNAAKYAELESSVTDAETKVPEIQKEIAYTENLLETQKAQALQALQTQGELQTFQNKMNGLDTAYKKGGMSSEQYRQQRQGLITQNQELLSSYEKLIGIPVDMGNISGAIDNLKNKNMELNGLAESNSKQLEAYQQALSQYSEAAKSMVEMDFGMSFAEAIAQGSDKLPYMEQQLTNIMQKMQLIPENKQVRVTDNGSIEIIDKQLSDIEKEHKSLELEASADWLTNLNSIGNVDIAVNADGAFSVLNTVTGEIQTLQGIGATNLQVNADGNIDVLNKAQEVIATIDSKSAQINIDGQAYGLEQIQQAKQTADGLQNKSVTAQVVGSFNGQDIIATAVDYQSKLQNVNKVQTATGKFPGKDEIATALSYQSQLHDKSVTHTVTYVQKGTPPANNAAGTSNWRGGLTYVNDQNINDPREVIEHKGMRYWYEGKNILADIPRGAKIYNALQSRAFINGSHRNGLERVPFDGYIAELHAGERVLTDTEASDYRENGLFAQAIERLREALNGSGKDNSRNGDNGNNGTQINFSPNVTINGNSDEGTIISAMKISAREFKKMYEEMVRDERRKTF